MEQLAVIPTIGIGGPLAILAMLFPALFGGALLVLHRWVVLLAVASVNSLLLAVHLWFGRALDGTWLATPRGLWFVMLLVTQAGVLWSWRRQVRTVQACGTASCGGRTEQVMLWIGSAGFLTAFLLCWYGTPVGDDPTWRLLLVFAIGFTAAALAALYRVVAGQARPGLGLPMEGIILGSMAVASVGLAATWPGQAVSVAGVGQAGQAIASGGGKKAVRIKAAWTFVPADRPGLIVSSCRVQGQHLYVAAAHRRGAETYGVLYCLDRGTGKELWHFDNGGTMRQVFSTPCLADGRLFFGEGFHTDPDCRFYCLDARTGRRLWEFATASHTESSPCVAKGRVYFGAGDDGIYCLDAQTGKKRWQYPGKSGDTTPTTFGRPAGIPGKGHRLRLHVDDDPAVVGERLYAGSGIGRAGEETADPAVFCLDANTGRKIWLVELPSNLPAWGSPVVDGGRVFFGLGNGDVFGDASDQASAGALLCLDAGTGRELWRYPVPNGVLKRPAVDTHHVYFGARDGNAYCLARAGGGLRWKRWLGSPVVAAPALARCSCCRATAAVYFLASAGHLFCLDPDTGGLMGSYDLDRPAHVSASPVVEVIPALGGDWRRVYFGAGLDGLAVPVVYCFEDQPAN
jgi:outer membrane protein assembly factor BamB